MYLNECVSKNKDDGSFGSESVEDYSIAAWSLFHFSNEYVDISRFSQVDRGFCHLFFLPDFAVGGQNDDRNEF